MTRRYAALVAAALLLAGCGDRVGDVGTGSPSPAATETMTVRTAIAPGRHGMLFIEGAVPEIRLVADDGTRFAPRHDHLATAVFHGLAPGPHRLEAALRPCDGNCGYLDGPTTPCAADVQVPVVGAVEVSWHVGRPCRVVR